MLSSPRLSVLSSGMLRCSTLTSLAPRCYQLSACLAPGCGEGYVVTFRSAALAAKLSWLEVWYEYGILAFNVIRSVDP